jgi:hypothetical protein
MTLSPDFSVLRPCRRTAFGRLADIVVSSALGCQSINSLELD